MNTKRICLFSLLGFFSIWQFFGFAAIAPRSETFLQATRHPAETAVISPAGTQSPEIPVTGKPEPVWIEILVFYGLIGLTALFLILALLSLANKSTAPQVGHKCSPADKTTEP